MSVHVIALTKGGKVAAYVYDEYGVTPDIDHARIARSEASCNALVRKWSGMLMRRDYRYYGVYDGVVSIPVHVMPLSQEAVQRALDNPGINNN